MKPSNPREHPADYMPKRESSARQNNWPKHQFFADWCWLFPRKNHSDIDIPHLEKGKKNISLKSSLPSLFLGSPRMVAQFLSHSSVMPNLNFHNKHQGKTEHLAAVWPSWDRPISPWNPYLVGGFNHLEKWWSSSIGMIKVFPIWWESHKIPWLPTTNQSIIIYHHL
jgi:hypothetical protein